MQRRARVSISAPELARPRTALQDRYRHAPVRIDAARSTQRPRLAPRLQKRLPTRTIRASCASSYGVGVQNIEQIANMPFLLALALLLGTLYLVWRRRAPVVALDGKAIFITGCDTVFGRLMALEYCREGAHVFAACLTNDAVDALSAEASGIGRISTVLLDVTDADQVQAAYEYVRSELEKEKKQLYALVNNAGIFAGWYVEMTTMAEYKRVMDVNFLGCVHVTKSFLPLIESPAGRIITITSCASLASSPGFSAYAASKYAQTAFMDALRRELAYCGIHAVKIVPGFFATPMIVGNSFEDKVHRRWNEAPRNIQQRYPPSLAKNSRESGDLVRKFAGDPTLVVQAVDRALRRRKPPVRILVGHDAHFLVWPMSLLPDAVLDAILGWVSFL